MSIKLRVSIHYHILQLNYRPNSHFTYVVISMANIFTNLRWDRILGHVVNYEIAEYILDQYA